MHLDELKNKLYKGNVPERWYSLNQGLKPDACIIYKNYTNWECFYVDEKGDKHDYKIFQNDEDAYDYLWEKMEYQLRIFKIPPQKGE